MDTTSPTRGFAAPAFSETGLCRKCGAVGADARYCDGRERTPFSNPERCTCAFSVDHLHRTCPRCGYSWIERCADAREEHGR